MALATDGVLGSLAISVAAPSTPSALDSWNWPLRRPDTFAALQQTATGFSDVVLQHSPVMLTGMVAGAVVVLFVLLL